MITLHWQWLIFIPVALILLYLTFKEPQRTGGYLDLSGLNNLLWGIVLVVFVLVWGGIFWW
jgi:hypothetical protein